MDLLEAAVTAVENEAAVKAKEENKPTAIAEVKIKESEEKDCKEPKKKQEKPVEQKSVKEVSELREKVSAMSSQLKSLRAFKMEHMDKKKRIMAKRGAVF